MKRIISIVAIAALAPAGAGAQDFRVVCAKGDDVRAIEVLKPGAVGAACDVRYARADGEEATTPYHADNSPDYCAPKAVDLVETLKQAGYDCAPPEGNESAAAESPETELAGAEPVATETVHVASADAAVAQTPRAGERANAPANESDQDAMRTTLTEPPAPAPQNAAVRGPAQLTAGASEQPAGAASGAAVGRLVGASPSAAPAAGPSGRSATAVTQAGLTVDAQDAAATAEPTVAAPPPTAADAPAKSAESRKPEDVIRATLAAQAAAWNEGNLDAFMAIYWKSDDLKFVSGVDVVKGWSSTMKRYRDRYADDSGLGWLSFDKIDVTMVTDNVAVVTGRFNHSKGDAATSGVFSLVMRRQDGVWRIVHDHTSADPKTGQ